MDYSQYANSAYGYPPGYTDPYAQPQQQQQLQYQSAVPSIRNPFAPPPPPPRGQFLGQNASYDPEYEAQVAQWQSAYAPQDQQDRGRKNGKDGGKAENPNLAPIGVRGQAPPSTTPVTGNSEPVQTEDDKTKKKTVLRKGGGETWEDPTLLEWDPNQFRLMVGNLAGEVTDESLAKAFANYGVAKARVVRDKRTTKSRGYGFVSFTDSDLGYKAGREMLGKYIGSHPVTIQRAKTDVRPVVKKENKKGKNNRSGQKSMKQDDALRANTGAGVEKKPVKNPGLKLLG